jgi:hypothetical protein
MSHSDHIDRDAVMARLAESRAEISRLLEPPNESADRKPRASADGAFPRSRTMRALLTGRGLGAAGAVAGGLLLSRPGLAWRLLRMFPAGALSRIVMARMLGGMRGKR